MFPQAAQAYSLYFVWELRERAIYKTLYGNLPDISEWRNICRNVEIKLTYLKVRLSLSLVPSLRTIRGRFRRFPHRSCSLLRPRLHYTTPFSKRFPSTLIVFVSFSPVHTTTRIRIENAVKPYILLGLVHTTPFSNENDTILFRFQKDLRPH